MRSLPSLWSSLRASLPRPLRAPVRRRRYRPLRRRAPRRRPSRPRAQRRPPIRRATATPCRRTVHRRAGGEISRRGHRDGRRAARGLPDGKRIAFWRTGPQGNNPQELRVLDTRRCRGESCPSPPVSSAASCGPTRHRSPVCGPAASRFPELVVVRVFGARELRLSAPQAPAATHTSLNSRTERSSFRSAGQGRLCRNRTRHGEGGMGRSYVTWDRRAQTAVNRP